MDRPGYKWITAILFIAGLIWVGIWIKTDIQTSENALSPSNVIEKRIRVSYEIANKLGSAADKILFWADMPSQDLVLQTVEIELAREEEYKNVRFSDKKLQLDFEPLAPFARRRVDVDLIVMMVSSPQGTIEFTADELAPFLASDMYVNATDSEIEMLSEDLAADSARATAHNVYQWVKNNIQSLSYRLEPVSSLSVLKKREGDCTDIMFLVAALLRSQGIPTRTVAGYLVERSAVKLDSSMYHNWAEFYDGVRWVLIDPQRSKFDQDYEQYLYIKNVDSTTVLASRFGVIGARGVTAKML